LKNAVKRIKDTSFLNHAKAAMTLALFLYYISVTTGSPICFDDSYSYIVAMGVPFETVFSALKYAWRPWSVPAFFSLFGPYTLRSALDIVMVQSVLFFISWALFAHLICKKLFDSAVSSCIAYAFLLGMVFSQGYYHYNQFITSDSLALSAIFLLFSVALLTSSLDDAQSGTRKSWRPILSDLFLFVFAVAIGARDANVMIGLCAALYFVLRALKSSQSTFSRCFVSVVVLALVWMQLPYASARHLINADNLLVGFVLPNQKARDFFVQRGMPLDLATVGKDLQEQDFGNVSLQQMYKGRAAVNNLDSLEKFIPHFDAAYLRYVLSNPGVFVDITVKNLDTIFRQDLRLETAAVAHPRPTDSIPIIFGREVRPLLFGGEHALAISLASLSLHLMFLIYQRTLSPIPLLIAALGAANAVAGFHGDLWELSEMARHAFIGSFLFRVGAALSFVCVCDCLAQLAISKGTLWTGPLRSKPH